MATKRQKKQAVRTAKKVAKKSPILFIILVLLIVGLAVGGFILYKNGYFDKWFSKNENQNSEVKDTPITVNGDIQIYSIEMRDKYGDSLFIKYGDYDVLIDAGDAGDGEFVRNFVDSHISSDKNLDLLVVTHCHSDHMGGLTKMSSKDTGAKALDNVSTISNIVDFGHVRTSNAMYSSYNELRTKYINLGANYYPAYESVKHLDGLDNKIQFGDLNIEIIDTFNYLSKSTDANTISDVNYNEYSVATLFTYKNTKLFCAGDLEDTGEKTLVEHANETSLKDVKKEDTVIYKACHHGTDVGSANNKTSGANSTNGGNRMALLKIINPDYCFVSAAIGESDHPFPRAVATMLYFTNNVYFNGTMGTIVLDLDGTNVGVQGLGVTTNYTLEGFTIDYEAEKNLRYTETTWYNNHKFEGTKTWYKGDKTNPTEKELTEWYLAELREDYPL
ncbi:MAG: MBL fold metallo-hydrolase [Acholeplasmatales bacterium]|nr:MBL fold metallo-hydrolase [Acholeplasmatales bacterium]